MKLLILSAVLFGLVMTAQQTRIIFPSNCPPKDNGQPPFGYSCQQDCGGQAGCQPGTFCCEVSCGNTCLTRHQAVLSSRCPPHNPDLRCIVFLNQCNNDDDCRRDDGQEGICCFQSACGRSCYTPYDNVRPYQG